MRGQAGAITADERARPRGPTARRMISSWPCTARTPGTDAYVRIYNSDGSEAGARQRHALHRRAAVQGDRQAHADVRDQGRLLDCWKDDAPGLSTVDMACRGLPGGILAARSTTPARSTCNRPAGADPARPSVVSMGNPHAIFWVGDVNDYALAKLGPPLEHDPIFPERANISLAQVASREHIVLRTWERGAGPPGRVTPARRRRRGAPRSHRPHGTVTLPGDLRICWRERDDHVLMTGPVEFEYEGKFAPALFCQTGGGVGGSSANGDPRCAWCRALAHRAARRGECRRHHLRLPAQHLRSEVIRRQARAADLPRPSSSTPAR